ncbi:MAG TPA: EamA family transporter [Methylomirabilota bacterium]|nr:EamA family transporter [Methylomirabilota bacterium]
MDQLPMPTEPKPSPDRGPIWVGLLILYVVWGSTYLGIAVAVETIPPFLMAAVRFGIAGSVLLGWSLLRAGSSFVTPSRRELRDTIIVGTLLLGGGMGMVAFGEQTIPSGIAALLIALMPVWVAIFGRGFLGETLPRLAGVGIVVGFVGVAILIGPTILGSAGALDPLGLGAIIISPISWSLGSLYASHRAILPRQPLVATGAQMLAGGIVLAVMAGLSGEFGRFDPAAVSTDSIVAVVYLTLIGSLLAFTAFGWLLRVAPLPLIATYAYVNPVVAVILGAFVRHEPIDPRTLVAGAVIVGAVALIVTARGRMQAPAVRRAAAPSPGQATART